jgi:signal-transduction protein with cAMP-binding, CBS, and nucleotidyltransferase domain
MDNPLRQPDEILACRSLQQILAPRLRSVWSVSPADTVLTAVQLMADKDNGFLVVLQQGRLVGVLSERDCARKVVLGKKSPEATAVADIMVADVVTVDLSYKFAECLKLMHQHAIRHLPVVDDGKVIAVVSIRDLLSEAVAHHARVIAQLEQERMTVFMSTA